MDLGLTEEQGMFKKVAADFVKREAPPHVNTTWFRDRETFQHALYRKADELGWLGMMCPEEYGGAAASFTDCGILFEELGRAPLPGPFFSSGVLGAQLIMEGGSDAQKQSWLPEICIAKRIAVPAITDTGVHWSNDAVETRLIKNGGNFTLEGTKRFVFDAQAATSFICAARTENCGVALVLVDQSAPGITVTPHVGFMVSVAEVRFEKVEVPASNILSAGEGWRVLDVALEKVLPILCAYQVGACQEVFDLTVEYTKNRIVFGQPIGRFQRVQDHCVELANHLDAARWVTYETLWKLDTGQAAKASVHEAKAVASFGYYEACNYAHMVFAGPGTDYQHPLMAHSIMAHTLYQYLGTPQHHKRQMIDTLYPREIR